MKNLTSKIAALAFFVLLACSEDENNDPTPQLASNQVAYGNTTYDLKNGLLDNYYDLDTDNHYNIDFTVTDGVFIPFLTDLGLGLTTTLWLTSDATIEIAAQLYSPGTDGFRLGTFEFSDLSENEVNNAQLIGTYFFNEAYVGVDTDGDQEVSEEEEVAVTGGTIQVSGTYPDYTLVYDLTLANGVALQGAFSSDEFVVDD